MEPFEIMVSESQERMLCVVAPERVGALLDVCERWEVLATPIGSVTTGDRLRVLKRGAAVADLPVEVLVDDCPLYDLEPEPPEQPLYRAARRRCSSGDRARGASRCSRCCARANIASRRPVFEQYDPVVQSRTVRRPDEADAAVLALPDGAAIAVSIDGNGRRVACDPRARRRRGGVRVRGEPGLRRAPSRSGLTNCLNFGNPEKPHVAWQLTEAVEGLAEACEAARRAGRRRQRVALQRGARPARSSRRRSSGSSAGSPTPPGPGGSGSRDEGDAIALVGPFDPSLAGSELAKLRGEAAAGTLPPIDPAAVARGPPARSARASASGALRSAHDIAEGGLAVALAECCIAGGDRRRR